MISEKERLESLRLHPLCGACMVPHPCNCDGFRVIDQMRKYARFHSGDDDMSMMQSLYRIARDGYEAAAADSQNGLWNKNWHHRSVPAGPPLMFDDHKRIVVKR